MIGRPVLLAVAVVAGVAAGALGERAERSRFAATDPYDLAYLPEGSVLRVASLGHRRLLADVVWLRAIQYYGEHRLTDRNYDQAEKLFTVIYDLDSSFTNATRFGAVVLAEDAGDPDGALALLQRGAADRPDAWEYPFDQGFINHAVKRDFAAAADCYRRASECPGAPDLAIRLAGVSLARLGDRESAREVWRAMLADSDNDIMRQLAERSLMNLDLEDAQDRLTDRVQRFRAETGRSPADWNELVAAGYLGQMPVDPFGGAFFYDDTTGRVFATTHVDRVMASQRELFTQLVRTIRERHGRYPESLDDLRASGVTTAEPWKPFGLALDYDPGTGSISWNPPWPEVEIGRHGGGRT